MTIYSQHSNRGKAQILATYRGATGVTSTTVTSVDDIATAAPIVNALNRVSAYATMPVSVHDERDGHFAYYPADHLEALAESGTRDNLVRGSHSLWYIQATKYLHHALTDLDRAVARLPLPVQKAIAAELLTESRNLREALADFTEGIEPPEVSDRRLWDFEAPFIVVDTGDPLDRDNRERLDRLELDVTDDDRAEAAANLRVLIDSQLLTEKAATRLELDNFSITDDPFTEDDAGYFLEVEAPLPGGGHRRTTWAAVLCRWEPDAPDDEDGGATGEPVLRCARSTPLTTTQITELLDLSGGRPDQLAAWAETRVGDALGGTTFVVTERYEK